MKFAHYDFSHQIQNMMEWCDVWTPCERTVAVFTLLRKLDPVEMKFISHILGQISLESGRAILTKEEQANNPGLPF